MTGTSWGCIFPRAIFRLLCRLWKKGVGGCWNFRTVRVTAVKIDTRHRTVSSLTASACCSRPGGDPSRWHRTAHRGWTRACIFRIPGETLGSGRCLEERERERGGAVGWSRSRMSVGRRPDQLVCRGLKILLQETSCKSGTTRLTLLLASGQSRPSPPVPAPSRSPTAVERVWRSLSLRRTTQPCIRSGRTGSRWGHDRRDVRETK